ARPDWMLAAELAVRLGADLGFGDAAEVLAEVGRVAPSHLGIDAAAVADAPDGLLLPLGTAPEPTGSGDAGHEGAEADAAAVRADAADDTEVAQAEEAAATEAEGEATADDADADPAVPAAEPA